MKKKERISITLDKRVISFLNDVIRDGRYRNRSHAVELAIKLLEEKEKKDKK